MRFGFSTLMALATVTGLAQEKVTFQDHVLPVVEANCAKCHNSDKKKGDLDLTSYSAALAGGASGKIVVAGDPESSKVWKVINHAEDPAMPPNRGKMTDKELAVFRKWIAGGLLETLNSKAAASKPGQDLSLGTVAVGKPDGPPPMPGELLLEPALATKGRTAVTGLAASPWAPVLAAAGQKQIALYHTETFELLGVLPFRDEQESSQPVDVKFSRNGQLLVVGGGHAAKTGRVMVFDLRSGRRIISVGAGQEFDVALASDLSPDQSRIVFGGPSRVVKVFSTKDGSLLFKMKKHTDWVTAAAFSPNGEWLATADRNGGITVWDAENGLEIHTLAGHKAGVTALNWRPDSKVIASSSEDGSAKIWEMQEGKQVKTWNPHPAGALAISYAPDGRLVTCGRDNLVIVWSAEGARIKSLEFTNELPVRVVFGHDGRRVIGSDWLGQLTVWNAADGRRLTELPANPPTLAERIAATEARLRELQSGQPSASPERRAAEAALASARLAWEKASNALTAAKSALLPKEAEAARLKAEVAAASTPTLVARHQAAREIRNAARLAVTNAVGELAARATEFRQLSKVTAATPQLTAAEEAALLRTRLARLQAARGLSAVSQVRESLAARQRERDQLLASGSKADKAAADKLGPEILRLEKDLQRLGGEYEKLKSASSASSVPGPTSL